jgi:hypothetical protein
MRNLIIPALLLACACGPQPPLKPVASIEQIMEGIVHPSSTVIFQSVGTIISEKGVEEIAPKNDQEWGDVARNAAVLAEAGNLLMMEGRARNQDDWMNRARNLMEAAVDAARASGAKDAQALFDAGGKVYEACEQCHGRYRNQ